MDIIKTVKLIEIDGQILRLVDLTLNDPIMYTEPTISSGK